MEIVQVKEKRKKSLWSNLLRTLIAWNKSKRWRWSSKCKGLIKELKCHLILQKTRRLAIIRQSTTDIALCLYNGLRQQALTKAEQLYKDYCLVSAYDHIEEFCQCLEANIFRISNQSSAESLPCNVNEAMASLIFVASRCGQLPELVRLRNLLRDRYGKKYEIVNVELLPGNHVSTQMREKICVTSVPHAEKLRLLDQVAAEDPFLQLQAYNESAGHLSPQPQKIQGHSTDTKDICAEC